MQIFIRTLALLVSLGLLVLLSWSCSPGRICVLSRLHSSSVVFCHKALPSSSFHPAADTRGIQGSGVSEPSSHAMAVLLWGLMFPHHHGRCGSALPCPHGQLHLLSSVPLPFLSLLFLELQVILALLVSCWLGLSLSSALEAWRSSGVYRAPQGGFLFLRGGGGGSRTPLIQRSL